MSAFYTIPNSNPEKMSSQMRPTPLYSHHPSGCNGYPDHMKAESPNSPQIWPHNCGYSIPSYYHTCCNPSNYPGYCTFQPPHPQYPPPPMPHIQCYGGFPVYSEPYRYPYPVQYMPQPHYTANLPRFEYDKCMPMGYHCCGCPHHPSRPIKGDTTLKIEEQEPEAEKEDSQIPTTSLGFQNTPYPVVWFPSEHIKGSEHQRETAQRKHEEGNRKELGDIISGQVPRNAGLEPKVWNGWFPLDMNSLKHLMSSGEEKKVQDENASRRNPAVRGSVDEHHQDCRNALARTNGSWSNDWSGWVPLDIDALKQLLQQQDGMVITKDQQTGDAGKEEVNGEDMSTSPGSKTVRPKDNSPEKPVPENEAAKSPEITGALRTIPVKSMEEAKDMNKHARAAEKEGTLISIPVKPMEEAKDKNEAPKSAEKEGSLRSIPVKFMGEDKKVEKHNEGTDKEDNSVKKHNDGTQKHNAEERTQTKKTSKLPPVCLRLDPLPKKKNGKGNSRSPSPPTRKDQHADSLKPSSGVPEQRFEGSGSNTKLSADGDKVKQSQGAETEIGGVPGKGNIAGNGEARVEALKPSSPVSEQRVSERSGSNSNPSAYENEEKHCQREETESEGLLGKGSTTGKGEAGVEVLHPSSSVSVQSTEEGGSNSKPSADETEDKLSRRQETEIVDNESLSGSDCQTADQKMMPKLIPVEGTDTSNNVTEQTRERELDESRVVDGRSEEAVEKTTEEDINKPEKKSFSFAEAATMIQSAYRGYVVRKWDPLQKLRKIAKVRQEGVGIRSSVEGLQTGAGSLDPKQKLILGESIMKLLFELDTIQGLHPTVRDIRKSTANELVHLQEKLDSLALAQPELSSEDKSTGKAALEIPEDLSQNSSTIVGAASGMKNQANECESDTCSANMSEHVGDKLLLDHVCTSIGDGAQREIDDQPEKYQRNICFGDVREHGGDSLLNSVCTPDIEESQTGTPCEEKEQITGELDMSKAQVLVKSSEEPFVSGTDESSNVEGDVDNIGETCGYDVIPGSTDEQNACPLGASKEEFVHEETKGLSSGEMDEVVNALAELPIDAVEENEDAVSKCSEVFKAEESEKVEEDAAVDLELETALINPEKDVPAESSNVGVHGEQEISNAEKNEFPGQGDTSMKPENDTVFGGKLTHYNQVVDEVKEVIEASVEMNKETWNKSLEESEVDRPEHPVPVCETMISSSEKETSEDTMRSEGLGDGVCNSLAKCEPVEQTASNVVVEAEEPLTFPLDAKHKEEDEKEKKILEENENLRATLEKLIASGKEQQKMIDSLSGKVKDLKGKLASQEKKKNKAAAKRVRVMMPRSRCKESKDTMRQNPMGLAS